MRNMLLVIVGGLVLWLFFFAGESEKSILPILEPVPQVDEAVQAKLQKLNSQLSHLNSEIAVLDSKIKQLNAERTAANKAREAAERARKENQPSGGYSKITDDLFFVNAIRREENNKKTLEPEVNRLKSEIAHIQSEIGSAGPKK